MDKKLKAKLTQFERFGLYQPQFEKDACGVGFVANITGKRSHSIVEKAIEATINLTHRGAVSADSKTGDGAGLLTQVPHKFFKNEVEKLGGNISDQAGIGVGMIFFPHKNKEDQEQCRKIIEETIAKNKLQFWGWRKVPIESSVLGEKALSTIPQIEQVLIGNAQKQQPIDFERNLYLTRKEIEKRVSELKIADFYIPSFSHKTIVYKGLFVAPQLKFYKDLFDKNFETSLALFHQRYSTNTFPNWHLAQAFRMLAHNGEINTLRGNVNWLKAREDDLESPVWKDKIDILKPILQEGGSDSALLDNALEALVLSGRSILHAVTMMIPEAYQNMHHMDPALRAFYEYHACLQEPWDGPAALAFTDGDIVGARLDRNGLRPARYIVTDDGMIVMGWTSLK